MARKVIGPTGSRRRRWLFPLCLIVALGTAVFFIAGAGATSTNLNIVGPSNFEVGDGNMTLDAASDHTDWNCFFPSTNGNGGNTCSKTSGATLTQADQGSLGEVTWKPGQKFDTPCATLISGSVPNKDDFTYIGTYTEFNNSNKLFFDGAAIRLVSNGNASGDVEFNQAQAGDQAGCNGTPRTNHDIMIAYDFLGGGNKPASLSFHTLTWTTNSSDTCYVKQDSPPCWTGGDAVSTNLYDGQSNTAAIAAGDNGMSNELLDIGRFAEFGINLTDAFAPTQLPCFASQTWESRSSGSSFTSNPEDIETVSHPTCGALTIIKRTLNGGGTRSGVDQNFGYTTTGVLTPPTFTLNDKAGATGDVACPVQTGTCNTRTYSDVSAGTYTVTETLPVTNFNLKSLTCYGGEFGGDKDNQTTISGATATIHLSPSDNVVCTYTNQQQLGAIRINKTSSKGANPPVLQGAKFYLCTNNTTSTSSCTAPTGVTNPLTTDANGTACQASLAFTDYYVFESAAPSGYAIDDGTATKVTVNSNGDCSGSSSQSNTLSYTDTPLSKIYVGWHSLAGNGVTTATIQCTGENAASTFTDGGSTPTITKTLGNGSTTLEPGTYSCTVVIDP